MSQQAQGGASRRQLNGEEEEDEDDEVNDPEAWERAYADERSWEPLQGDESGLLRPIDNLSLQHAQYRRRIRNLSSPHTFARIQKGLIHYLYLVLDLSKAAGETDFRPTRMAMMAKYVELFIREFFDQNPLSQISLVTVKDGVAHNLTDLGGSLESHIEAECTGSCPWVFKPNPVIWASGSFDIVLSSQYM